MTALNSDQCKTVVANFEDKFIAEHVFNIERAVSSIKSRSDLETGTDLENALSFAITRLTELEIALHATNDEIARKLLDQTLERLGLIVVDPNKKSNETKDNQDTESDQGF